MHVTFVRLEWELPKRSSPAALTIGVSEISRPKSQVLLRCGDGILNVASEGSHSRRILHLFNLWRLDLNPRGAVPYGGGGAVALTHERHDNPRRHAAARHDNGSRSLAD